MFNGSKVPPEATPDSLGMKGHATLSWEQTVFNGIHNIKSGKEVTALDMEGGVDNDMSSTIDIVFVDTSSSDEVLLRYVSYWKMKTLLSRYAAMREVPLKSLRFKCNNRMLFVSSIGNKSPYDLGIQNNDVVYASLLGNVDVKLDEAGTTKKSGRSQRSTRAAKGKTKSNSKKKASCQPTYSTIDDEERLRRAHSKMLSRVFDEANPQFKKIRQKLNSLALKQTPPKSKSSSPRARVKESKTDMSDISSFSLDNKAIKTRSISSLVK
ncbi:hypothetical protein QTG54_015356 [Skeletonema marinoi]|uniref:Ubiquitin-like domain-containing protein n=1 Tax=Skeletonema marinoi TaxID=267567 RepID=A0AAD9D5K5_9STRA|nr:hypothetical protein QTG54_015356 [Skeletonema marinoi]